MKKNNKIKETVREKYKNIVLNYDTGINKSCCKQDSCCGNDYTILSDDYTKVKGYNSEADLGLGCGLPTEYALIKEGDTVIDLGSGAGNDVFIARTITGDNGKVIGIDFTEEMIKKAGENSNKLGFKNVEFRLGDIENIPVSDNEADVIISNCVLNLVPDKEKAFKEIFRILKPGGHFSVSDIVTTGELPLSIKNIAELYAGCIAGAVEKSEYVKIIYNTGFQGIKIQMEKAINIPDNLFLKHISKEEFEKFRESGTKLISITIYAEKPINSF